MHINKTKEKLSKLTDDDLDILLSLVKSEYKSRGRVNSHNDVVSNFVSNTTHSETEQAASMDNMFGRAWIHG